MENLLNRLKEEGSQALAWATDQLMFPTPYSARALTVLAIILAGLVVIRIWQRFWYVDGPRLMAAVAALPLALLITHHAQPGWSGTADDRCHQFSGGAITFELVAQPFFTPMDPANLVEGKNWLVLIVRNKERFGPDFHTCRIDARSESAQSFYRAWAAIMASMVENGISFEQASQYGSLTFSFTNDKNGERPGVTFNPLRPEDNQKGPPEVAPEA